MLRNIGDFDKNVVEVWNKLKQDCCYFVTKALSQIMLPYFYPFPRSYQEHVPSPGGKVIIDLRRDSNLREAAAVRDGQHHKVLAQKPVEIKPCQSFGKEKAALSSYPCGKVPLLFARPGCCMKCLDPCTSRCSKEIERESVHNDAQKGAKVYSSTRSLEPTRKSQGSLMC